MSGGGIANVATHFRFQRARFFYLIF